MATEDGEPEGKFLASSSSSLLLLSAFLAMEPSHTLIRFSRECGSESSITLAAQRFIWDHCIRKPQSQDGKCYVPYVKNFLKKLINEIEVEHGEVLDELYERYAQYMISAKDGCKEISRVLKYISFLFPDDCLRLSSCPESMKLIIPLQCSLNMLEGDTGCSIWPSSLFLSEFILSNPHIFSKKTCFEVGSGVGLVGICLTHVKPLKVILTDGDLSTLANMKLNLQLNQLATNNDVLEEFSQDSNLVQCISMPWESAKASELQAYMPDIILAADVIYDPLCLPHLIRVLRILLGETEANENSCKDHRCGFSSDGVSINGEAGLIDAAYALDQTTVMKKNNEIKLDLNGENTDCGFNNHRARSRNPAPVAYIASVIRNIETFNYFLALADQASLSVTDITEQVELFNLLPYMDSYDRSSIRLFTIKFLRN